MYNGRAPDPQGSQTNGSASRADPVSFRQEWQDTVKVAGPNDETPIARLKRRVFTPIEEKFYVPLNRLIDRLGYISSALLLVGIMGASAVAIRLWNRPDEGRRAITVALFYWEARRPSPPRNPAVAEVMRDLTNQLQDAISPSNRNSPSVGGDWVQAQMALSLQGKDAFDTTELVKWFHGEAESCRCWRAGPQDQEHLGAAGWVLLAFAKMRAKPTEEEVEFVLRNQHRPGWWPIYPALDNPRNASTYATAFSTWSLEELLERDLIPVSQIQRATEAMQRGRNWLFNNTVPGRPGRWKDYPNGEYGIESIGISGLVLHVLHRTPGPSPSASDVDWMIDLPSDLPAPKDTFSSGQTVYVTDQHATEDPTHNFAFPWLIIGTADAYGRGSLSQRAQACRLFHQIPEKRQAIATELRDMPWLASEILISLRHLQGDDVI
jgi:hypothetical protein